MGGENGDGLICAISVLNLRSSGCPPFAPSPVRSHLRAPLPSDVEPQFPRDVETFVYGGADVNLGGFVKVRMNPGCSSWWRGRIT